MTAALVDYLNQWKANGGDLFCWLDTIKGPGRYGDWGAWYSYCESGDTPKSLALKSYDGPLGGHVSDIAYYNSISLFLDKAKSGNGWASQAPGLEYGHGPALELDVNGNLTAPPQYSAAFLIQNQFPQVN